MTLNYRLDFHDAGEIANQDPFSDAGLFMPLDIPDVNDILAAIASVFGTIPAVAFPSQGAWIDLAAADLRRDEAVARWSQGETP